MRRVQRDDADAFAQLYDRYAARALRIATAICRQPDAAEEAVQEAFVAIWKRRGSYQPLPGGFAAWAMTIVHDRAADAEALQRGAGPIGDAQRARTLLAGLPETQREVISLAFYGELTHTEIAARLSLPPGTVKGRMRLGLQTLSRRSRSRLATGQISLRPDGTAVSAVDGRATFSFSEHDESDGSVRVRLVGELDVARAPEVQAALRRLEGEGSDVLLDLTSLEFMDSFGLHLIEEAADAARRSGFGFAIAGPVPVAVRTVFIRAGAGHHLPGGQAHLAPASGSQPGQAAGAAPITVTYSDQTAADADQTLADRDQTSSDEDQTGSDRDRRASDDDQRSSERDQLSADRDQVEADRDQAAADDRHPGDEARHEQGRAARERTTVAREQTAGARAGIERVREATAAHRDAIASERDAMAAQRDTVAVARDRAAYARDRLADIGDLSGDAEAIARRARGDRQRAQANREEAARDRRRAADDRARGAHEREQAAHDREHGGHDSHHAGSH